MRVAKLAILPMLCCWSGLTPGRQAQAQTEQKFEVVSIKPNKSDGGVATIRPMPDGLRVQLPLRLVTRIYDQEWKEFLLPRGLCSATSIILCIANYRPRAATV